MKGEFSQKMSGNNNIFIKQSYPPPPYISEICSFLLCKTERFLTFFNCSHKTAYMVPVTALQELRTIGADML